MSTLSTSGVVIGGRRTLNKGVATFDGRPAPEDILRYALYWDRIDYACLDFIQPWLEVIPDLKLLHEVGRLRVVPVHVNMDDIPGGDDPSHGSINGYNLFQIIRAERKAQSIVFDNNRKNEGGHWSVAQTGETLDVYPLGQAGDKNVSIVSIALHNCLPIPAPDTPIEKVLQFRNDHKDSFDEFNAKFSELRERIGSSADSEIALANVVDEVKVSLEALRRHMSESFHVRLARTFEAYALPITGLIGSAILQFPSHPVVAGAVAAVDLAVIALTLREKHKYIQPDLAPYLYLFDVEDTFLKPPREKAKSAR